MYGYEFPFLDLDDNDEGAFVDVEQREIRGVASLPMHFPHRLPLLPRLRRDHGGRLPFLLGEYQAAVIARVWVVRLTLQVAEAMRDWEEKVVWEWGPGRGVHALPSRPASDLVDMREMYI